MIQTAAMYVFSFHFETWVTSRVRRVVYIYIWPGSTIWRSRSMIENGFHIRNKQRCWQTIFEGKVIFRFVVVDRSVCLDYYQITVNEHKLPKFARSFRQDLKQKFSIISVKWVHFYFTIVFNEMLILRTLITWESSTYQFALRLTVKRIPLSARQSPSVAIEPNLLSFVSLSSNIY